MLIIGLPVLQWACLRLTNPMFGFGSDGVLEDMCLASRILGLFGLGSQVLGLGLDTCVLDSWLHHCQRRWRYLRALAVALRVNLSFCRWSSRNPGLVAWISHWLHILGLDEQVLGLGCQVLGLDTVSSTLMFGLTTFHKHADVLSYVEPFKTRSARRLVFNS